MTRLLSTMQLDAQLQFRNGFYYAAAFVLAILAGLISQLPALDWDWLLPPVVMQNLIISTFYFFGGLVLLEKGEGTLEAQVTTPLRPSEYLASKVITLTALGLVENLIVVFLAYGPGFRILPLLIGIVATGAGYALLGFIAVVRYDSINEYLFPSLLYTALFSLPLLNYFGLVRSWLFYLHPFQAALLLLQAAFQPVELWQWVYGLLYSGLWIGLVFLMSRRAFHRFIIRKEGVR